MRTLIAAIVLVSCLARIAHSQDRLTIDVDPRVELFSIVQVIAGRMDNRLPTPYARAVREHFERFRDHRAVQVMESMVSGTLSWGIPAALGTAVDSSYRPRIALPTQLALRPIPEDTIALYVEAVRDFAAASGFDAFFRTHRPFHERLVQETRASLGTADYLGEVEAYWGDRQHSYAIHLSPLMPAGGVGPRVVLPDGSVEVHSILGAFFVRDSVPVFGSAASLRNLVLHEFSHSFVNPVTERHQAAVDAWELLMYPLRNRLRQADGLTRWSEAVNEFVIRAFTANRMERVDGPDRTRSFVASQKALGFMYLDRFREWLREYEADRARWPTFASYYPSLVAHFAGLASSHLTVDSVRAPYRGDFSMAPWFNEEFFMVMIVPTQEDNTALQDSLYRLVRQIRDTNYPTSMIVRDVDALGQDLSRFTLWAWGTVDGNAWLRQHREHLPITIARDRVVADSAYAGTNLVVAMALRNPSNPAVPLRVSTGQRIEEVSRAWWNWSADYAIMEGGTRRSLGNWPVKTAERWGFPPR